MRNRSLFIALRLFLVMTFAAGVLYPLAVTAVARLAFPWQSGGSIVKIGSRPIGSTLMAQPPAGNAYFAWRPSAGNYGTVPSAASNLAVSSPMLRDSIANRRACWKNSIGEPPSDLLFSSGSGLDPHLSPEAALFQVDRVARARKMSTNDIAQLRAMVASRVEPPQFGILGQPRVNVLLLNCDIDRLKIIKRK